ncbi:hypothetical protein DFA_00335 [Cavenderia fasciculata]|uniref:PWWP domain-containing protein n=1 Tax=Cavenderia fasciculata TaxID=261658 RepID=F4PR63_CACFS|nr:uncharacterized protein DFA_00335 [Cavenderia fasciculata]EGG20474.1 hypothetical protein DFA_00335 [Cavenderia fasciculata]|eukprot:XP_004358324.1 hypothetical protein DFA_00335 [Cavenderia fasciculata]
MTQKKQQQELQNSNSSSTSLSLQQYFSPQSSSCSTTTTTTTTAPLQLSQLSSSQLSSSQVDLGISSYPEGEVLSVHYGDWGIWPVRVAKLSEVSPQTLKGSKKDQFLVYFFGSQDYGLVKETQIRQYRPEDLIKQKFKARDHTKLTKAIDEANDWKNLEEKDYPIYIPEPKKIKKEIDQDFLTPTKPLLSTTTTTTTATNQKPVALSKRKKKLIDSSPFIEIMPPKTTRTTTTRAKKGTKQLKKKEEVEEIYETSSFLQSTPKRTPLKFTTPSRDSHNDQTSNIKESPQQPNISPNTTPQSNRKKQLDFYPISSAQQHFQPIYVKQENGTTTLQSSLTSVQLEVELIHILSLRSYTMVEIKSRFNVSQVKDDSQITLALERVATTTNGQWMLKADQLEFINENWHGFKDDNERELVKKKKFDYLFHLNQQSPNPRQSASSNQLLPFFNATTPQPIAKQASLSPHKKKKHQPPPQLDASIDIITPIKPNKTKPTNRSSDFSSSSFSPQHRYPLDILNASSNLDTTIPLLDDDCVHNPATPSATILTTGDSADDDDEPIESTQGHDIPVLVENGSQQQNNSITNSANNNNNSNNPTIINNIFFQQQQQPEQTEHHQQQQQHHYPLPSQSPLPNTSTPPTPPPSHLYLYRPNSTPYSSPSSSIPATLVVTSPLSSNNNQSSSRKAKNYTSSTTTITTSFHHYPSPNDDSSDSDAFPPTMPVNFGAFEQGQPISSATNNNTSNNLSTRGGFSIINNQQKQQNDGDKTMVAKLLENEFLQKFINESIQDLFKSNKQVESVIEDKLSKIKDDLTEKVNNQLLLESRKRKKSFQTIIDSLDSIESSVRNLKQSLLSLDNNEEEDINSNNGSH